MKLNFRLMAVLAILSSLTACTPQPENSLMK